MNVTDLLPLKIQVKHLSALCCTLYDFTNKNITYRITKNYSKNIIGILGIYRKEIYTNHTYDPKDTTKFKNFLEKL